MAYADTAPKRHDSDNNLLFKIAQILNSGGGSGGGGSGSSTNYNLQSASDPVAAPADPAQGWTLLNTSTGTYWVWNTVTLSWLQIV